MRPSHGRAILAAAAVALAAIHLVETRFGRVKSKSVARARGPMQFVPSTWRIYWNGGTSRTPTHDPGRRPAAARPRGTGDYARALHHYNPSQV